MDARYIGVVVQCRSEPFTHKKHLKRYQTRSIKPTVLKTKFFMNYRSAVKWLREVSDEELRNFTKERYARYIRPVDLNRSPGT